MQKKKGISLIVLVITIIVMIVLVAAIVISLNSSDIIDKANEAVNKTDVKQVQELASLVWADKYIDGKRGNILKEEVLGELKDYTDIYDVEVTDRGVDVSKKDNSVPITTLGSLITEENYGDKVDYSVTVEGMTENNGTYSNWRILYHTEDYVYLILEDKLPTDVALEKDITVESLSEITIDTLPVGSNTLLDLYNIFRVGDGPKYTLTDMLGGIEMYNSPAVAKLIKNYTNFANTKTYGTNVVGAIGGPTLELLVAGWNAKGYTPTLEITIGDYGYKVNNTRLTSDGLYIPTGYEYWLAAPSNDNDCCIMYAGKDRVSDNLYDIALSVRPVVCLKSSIPAEKGTGEYDFELIKEQK